MKNLVLARLFMTAAFCMACASAMAQSLTSEPIRAILPFSAGSGPDSVVRSIGEMFTASGKGQFVVDNKPGANGWIAADAAKRSPADGHTVLLVDNAQMALQQHLYKKMPFDATKDFTPVTPLYTTYFFIVVPANSPWKTVGDLLAAAKAKPGRLNFGTWGIGSVAHVGTSMLESASATRMTHVPFKELPHLYTAVATGEVDWAFGSAATVGPLFKAGKVKLLAIAAPKRIPAYQDIPTVSESGGPANFELKTWVALVAPAGTPKAAIAQINSVTNGVLGDAELRSKLMNFGFEPWQGKPEDISKATTKDSAMFSAVVKKANISLD